MKKHKTQEETVMKTRAIITPGGGSGITNHTFGCIVNPLCVGMDDYEQILSNPLAHK